MNQTDAQQFFDELETFSSRCRKKLGLDPATRSPWGTPSFHNTHPQGAILHYTADPDTQRVLRWFCDPRQKANASAHVVVARGREDWAAGLDDDLPMIKALPATVVQCRLPTEVAWHATWTNSTCYGIENINTGEVRHAATNTGFVWWKPASSSAGEWTTPYTDDPILAFGRFWQPYTAEQVTADIMVIRAVNAFHGGTLEKQLIVGHENVQGVRTPGAIGHDKRDAGPHFPLHDLRMWALNHDGITQAQVLSTLQPCVTPTYCNDWRNRLGQSLLQTTNGWDALMSASANIGTGTTDGVVAKALLYVLGYNMVALASPQLSIEDTESIKVFQKMMGLGPDGVLGEQTRRAISARVADRFGV